MTIAQAIEMVDKLYPNHFEEATKIAWLAELDGKVFNDILSTHEDAPESFEMYTYDTDKDTMLLVPPPYSYSVYIRYLEMMMNQEYKETDRYNQAAALFNSAYLDFENWYNRTHLPLSGGRFRF